MLVHAVRAAAADLAVDEATAAAEREREREREIYARRPLLLLSYND